MPGSPVRTLDRGPTWDRDGRARPARVEAWNAVSAHVLFDDVRWTQRRLFRIAARLAQCAALPQQVPALVEFHLDARQAVVLAVGERSLAEEPVLFVHEFLDVRQNLVLRLALRR